MSITPDFRAKAQEVCSDLDGIYATDFGVIFEALSAAFEDGKKAGAEQERALWELAKINQELGIE